MKSAKAPPKDIDAYIAGFPKDEQIILQKVRATIRKAAPKATEAISYGIPTFKLNGNLVHFGGFKYHIGFFPGSKAIEFFADELKKFTTSKGTIQFPLDQPLPLVLITKIVKHRVGENLQDRVKSKSSRRSG